MSRSFDEPFSKKRENCTDKNFIFVRIYNYRMDTKLTLKLEKEVIEKAKEYASAQRRSLSSLVESYLKSLVTKENPEADPEISPYVKSLKTGVKVPADLDPKEVYSDFLAEKYK